VTHEELRTKAFEAAGKAFTQAAWDGRASAEPIFRDCVNAARSAAMDCVVAETQKVVAETIDTSYGQSVAYLRENIEQNLRRLKACK